MTNHNVINRRTVLRGVGSIAIALPWLDKNIFYAYSMSCI